MLRASKLTESQFRVFGGFLMRAAYETAWMGAAMFAQRPVDFLSLDALSFHLPVPIGAVLSLTSHVTYTTTAAAEAAAVADGQQSAGKEGSSIASVVVLAEVVDVETGERNKSNTVGGLRLLYCLSLFSLTEPSPHPSSTSASTLAPRTSAWCPSRTATAWPGSRAGAASSWARSSGGSTGCNEMP